MERTPKFPRKALSLTTRFRNRSSASPGSRIKSSTAAPSSPISSECNLDCTPPHRKFIFNPPYSPTNDLESSPVFRLSQSSTNCPDVTWRWTKDDPATEDSSLSSSLAKSTPKRNGDREQRKRRLLQRKQELHRAEIENIKDNRLKRELARKKQCEQMELLIAEQSNIVVSIKNNESTLALKAQSPSNSSGYGSNNNIDNIVDLLNDSDADGLLLEASQKVETNIKKSKITCTNELKPPNVKKNDNDKDKSSVCEHLHDSLDDWFASLDADLLVAQSQKPRTYLQRYKSMPTDSPVAANNTDRPQFKRYPSSSTLPPKTSSTMEFDIFEILKKKLKENRIKVRTGQIECFRTRSRNHGT